MSNSHIFFLIIAYAFTGFKRFLYFCEMFFISG